MAVVSICSDFGAPQNKVYHCFHCFPIYLNEVIGLDAMILVPVSGCDGYSLCWNPVCFFCLFVLFCFWLLGILVIFSWYVGDNVLCKRNFSKCTFINVMVNEVWGERKYFIVLCLSLSFSVSLNLWAMKSINVSWLFSSFLKCNRMTRVAWNWVFPFLRSVRLW